eukprot:1931865-Amphidinium_carterae.1
MEHCWTARTHSALKGLKERTIQTKVPYRWIFSSHSALADATRNLFDTNSISLEGVLTCSFGIALRTQLTIPLDSA